MLLWFVKIYEPGCRELVSYRYYIQLGESTGVVRVGENMQNPT